MRIDYQDLESNWDFLYYGPGTNYQRSSRTGGSGWTLDWITLTDRSTGDITSEGATHFVTDGSVTRKGFIVGKMRFCSSLSSPTIGDESPIGTRRVTGALLGTDDVVEFYYPARSGSNHVAISMWPEQSGTDFDIYARCGAKPTPTTYDYRAYSSDSQEWLDVTGCQGSTLFVTVHSYSGAGVFNVLAHEHLPAGHKTLYASKNWSGSPVTLADNNFSGFPTVPGDTTTITNAWANTLTETAKKVYAASQGQVIIDGYQLWDSFTLCSGCQTAMCDAKCGTKKCDVCMKNVGGTGQANASGNQMWGSITQVQFNPLWVHEYGHMLYAAPDEYTNGLASQWTCGHSLMGDHYVTGLNSFCTNHNHSKDPSPTAGSGPATSIHQNAKNNGKTGLRTQFFSETSDNYSFLDFDFNGFVGSVTIN